jgi:hypothetical protein
MPDLGLLTDENGYGVGQLTDRFVQSPYGQVVPTWLDALFAGGEEGIYTTTALLEVVDGIITLIDDTPRGGAGVSLSHDKRRLVPVNTLHFQLDDVVLADSVQGVRSLTGNASEQATMDQVLFARFAKMTRSMAAQMVFMRLQALMGMVRRRDGTVLANLFDKLGLQKQTAEFDLKSASADVLGMIRGAKHMSEDAVGDSGMITGYIGIAGRNFMNELLKNKDVKESWKFAQSAQNPLRDDLRGGFSHGDVLWREFYAKVGDTPFMDPDKALLVPIYAGANQTRYAPADYNQCVGTQGLPLYVWQKVRPDEKGVDISVQSNPLFYSQNPAANIELTIK